MCQHPDKSMMLCHITGLTSNGTIFRTSLNCFHRCGCLRQTRAHTNDYFWFIVSKTCKQNEILDSFKMSVFYIVSIMYSKLTKEINKASQQHISIWESSILTQQSSDPVRKCFSISVLKPHPHWCFLCHPEGIKIWKKVGTPAQIGTVTSLIDVKLLFL